MNSNEDAYFLEGGDYVARVNHYYDFVTGLYSDFYGEHFHICYQQEDESRDSAMARMNAMFLQHARIEPGYRVLDLGCGIGSLSMLIARTIGCNVTGVNVNEHQLSIARKRAREAGADVLFVQQDIMNLDLDPVYDVAFLIDVDCHLPNKDRAIRRILDTLRPGGRLVMTAWLQHAAPTLVEKQVFLRTLYRCNSFAHLASFEEYREIFDRCGVEIVHWEDGTRKIESYIEKLYRQPLELARQGISWAELMKAVRNPKLITAVLGSMLSGPLSETSARSGVEDLFLGVLFIKVCYDAGLFEFGFFVVEKPR